MSRRQRELLIGICVLAVCVGYVAWQRNQNAERRGSQEGVTAPPPDQLRDQSHTLNLLALATEDDFPGLADLLHAEHPPEVLRSWVGRDPRMFDRGVGPERIAQLSILGLPFEAVAVREQPIDREDRKQIALANYAMALITAEMTANDNTGDWGPTAANDLEELHQMDLEDEETTLLLARVHRLLGQVESGQDHHDRQGWLVLHDA